VPRVKECRRLVEDEWRERRTGDAVAFGDNFVDARPKCEVQYAGLSTTRQLRLKFLTVLCDEVDVVLFVDVDAAIGLIP